jgi:capsular polysaccharide biosynthesis protein
MDSNGSANSNTTGAFAPPSSPLDDADQLLARNRLSAKANRNASSGVLRRLAGRFWQILMLWLAISAPIVVRYLFIQPTYTATSLLLIEPAQPELFSPLKRGSDEEYDTNYLNTQVALIKSHKVLVPAIVNPLVVNLSTIRKTTDAVGDVLEKLKVGIVENTNLIRVSLELPNAAEAVTIVQAVVQSYQMQNNDYSRGAKKDLTESLKQQLEKIMTDIRATRAKLKELTQNGMSAPMEPRELLNPKTETDPTHPTLNKATEEQFSKLIDKQVQCDLDYLDAVSHLEATRTVRERHVDRINEELETRVAEEFKNDPSIAALVNQIEESKKLVESKEQAPPATVAAARAKHEQLSREYDAFWASRRKGIRKRLSDGDQGLLSEAKIRELEVAVEKARRKKEGFAQQFEKIKVIREPQNDTAFEVTYLNHQVTRLLTWEEQVKKNLEQLKWEASQDRYRVTLLDPASAPRIPTNNGRLKYMAAAPVAVFFLLLGLFLAQELMAGRNR